MFSSYFVHTSSGERSWISKLFWCNLFWHTKSACLKITQKSPHFSVLLRLTSERSELRTWKNILFGRKNELKKNHEWNIWGKYNWQLDRIHQYIIKSHWVSWIIFCILHQNKCYFPFLSLKKKLEVLMVILDALYCPIV